MPPPVYVVGDVHGHRDKLVELLRDAGLVDPSERWSGGDARLWLVGDLVDRGPDGIGAIELVRRLERESGGSARCLLGNHEALIVAARRFGGERASWGESFYELWKLNGGVDSDLGGLTDDDVDWLVGLAPLALDGEWLITHADTTAYLELGGSLDTVAHATSSALARGSSDDVEAVLEVLTDRMRLGDPAAVEALLEAYGGMRIVHGHTPIASVLAVDPHEVTEPLVYGGGRVTNVDHCLFAGGPGFVTRLESGPRPEA